MTHCSFPSPTGAHLCMKSAGHSGEHISFRNHWGAAKSPTIRWGGEPLGGATASPENPKPPEMSGNSCSTCGGFNMVRSGTCETCQNCGTTSGCS